MSRKSISLALFVAILFSFSNNLAQFNDYGLKGGIQGFGLLPDGDFGYDNIEVSYLGRAFLRIDLLEYLDIEIGAGYGLLAGNDLSNSYWETTIIPADLRILLSPFDYKSINPYGYAGAGLIKWTVNDKPSSRSPATNVEDDGYDLFIPLGVGLEVKLTNSLLLDISGGYSLTFTDDLDYFNNVDSPADGYNDGFWNFGVGLVFTGESGNSDSDLDGLTLDQEKTIGTNAEIPDTDGDGLIDGLEFNQYKTDPLATDTDGDGLSDNDEVKNFTTNPKNVDSDNDGLSDGEEINNYHTDPLRVDSDFDGISDSDEIFNTKTDATKSDTDHDGLKDGDEKDKYKTSPLLADTDTDGISDGDEVLKYNTNPTKIDTDGGTTNDKEEITRGSNPLNPEDDIILDVEAPIVLDGVTFETGRADLTPESEKMLLRVLNTLNAYPKMKVEIRGYTDNVGKASNNLALSQRRANSVRYWVLNKGVNPDRVVAKGYGEGNPIADNSTKEGRRLNRRIEFSRIN